MSNCKNYLINVKHKAKAMKNTTYHICKAMGYEFHGIGLESTLLVNAVPLRERSYWCPILAMGRLWMLVTIITAKWHRALGLVIKNYQDKIGTWLATKCFSLHQRILRGSNFNIELEYYHPLVFFPKVFFNKSIIRYRFALFRQGAVSLYKNRKVTSVRDNLLRPGQPLRRPTE